MQDQTNCTVGSDRQTHIKSEMNDLSNALSNLETEVDRIMSNISDVTTPIEQAPPALKEEVETSVVPLADKIREQRRRVTRSVELLVLTNNNIEL